MLALNFTLQSKIDFLLKRTECQTIRPKTDRIKKGDKLYLYANQRTKKCRKLGEAVCSEVIPITITRMESRGFISHSCLSIVTRERFLKTVDIAIDDGFDFISEFDDFFIQTHNIKPGDSKEFVIIKWRDFVPETTNDKKG